MIGLLTNKYVIMGIAVLILMFTIKMVFAKYNAVVEENGILKTSLATAEQVNKKNVAKILEMEANRKQMEAALLGLAKHNQQLEEEKNEKIGKWKDEVNRLRKSGDTCIDAPLPPGFFDGLPRKQPSSSRNGNKVRMSDRAFIGTRSPPVLWQKLVRYQTLYFELANSY